MQVVDQHLIGISGIANLISSIKMAMHEMPIRCRSSTSI